MVGKLKRLSGATQTALPYEHCVVKFVEQAGVHLTWLNLGAMGIHGNGHMMMLEKNSDQIADVIEKWVRKALAERRPAPRSAGRRGNGGIEDDHSGTFTGAPVSSDLITATEAAVTAIN